MKKGYSLNQKISSDYFSWISKNFEFDLSMILIGSGNINIKRDR